MGLSYAILNRHLFMNRQDLRLPTSPVPRRGGKVVKVYRDRPRRRADPAGRRGDRGDPGRTAYREQCRFPGRSIHRRRSATTCPTDESCSTRGSSGRGRRVRARRAGEPGAVHAVPPRHAAGEEWRDRPRAGGIRAGACAAAGSGRSQQRPWARSSRRQGDLDGGDRPLPRGARLDARLPGRAEQPRLRAAADRARRGSPRALREGARPAARFPRSAQQPRPALRARR